MTEVVSPVWKKLVFILAALLMLLPSVSGGLALLLGFALVLTMGNPFRAHSRKLTPLLLQTSVVGLGASMNLLTVFVTGFHGLFYTTIGIALTMGLGILLGRLLKIGSVTTLLLSAGTAICGGSAIAALSPSIRAKEHETSVSIATVFFLNSIALFAFPWMGHRAGLSETQFGLWCALAIHDTSSVVGAALQFGPRALEVATTIKLARALWIVPLTFLISYFYLKNTLKNRVSESGRKEKAKKPWFILGFLLMSAVMTWCEPLQFLAHPIAGASKRVLVLTLFLIGTALSVDALKAVGIRPLILGVVLWLLVASASFLAISHAWIT